MTKNVIKTLAKCFVDTGTGEFAFSLTKAITTSFISKIYSIEFSKIYYDKWASLIPKNQTRVNLIYGNSSIVLPGLLDQLNCEILFSLNACYSAKPDAMGNTYTALLDELDCIKKHPIKSHTIMIPDINRCGTMRFDFIKLETVIDILKDINRNYKFIYLNGIDDSTTLVAQVYTGSN